MKNIYIIIKFIIGKRSYICLGGEVFLRDIRIGTFCERDSITLNLKQCLQDCETDGYKFYYNVYVDNWIWQTVYNCSIIIYCLADPVSWLSLTEECLLL